MHVGSGQKSMAKQTPPHEKKKPMILGLRVPKEEINRHDVLLGRSQLSAKHTGNIAFRALVDSRLRLYKDATSKSSKTHIVVMLTNCVYEASGRFLFPEDHTLNLWAEVDRRYAREKVGNSLRDGVRMANSGKKRTSSGYDATYCESAHFASIVLGIAHAISSCKGGMDNQPKKVAATKATPASALSSAGSTASSKVPSRQKFQPPPPPPTQFPKETVDAPDSTDAYILGVLKKAADEGTDDEDDATETLTLLKIQEELQDFDDDASFEDWKAEHEAELKESKKDTPFASV